MTRTLLAKDDSQNGHITSSMVIGAVALLLLPLSAASAADTISVRSQFTGATPANAGLIQSIAGQAAVNSHIYSVLHARAADASQAAAALRAAASAASATPASSTELGAIQAIETADSQSQDNLQSLISSSGNSRSALTDLIVADEQSIGTQSDNEHTGFPAAMTLWIAALYQGQAANNLQQVEALQTSAVAALQAVVATPNNQNLAGASSNFSQLALAEEYAATCFAQAGAQIQMALGIQSSILLADADAQRLSGEIQSAATAQSQAASAMLASLSASTEGSSTIMNESVAGIQGAANAVSASDLHDAAGFISRALMSTAGYTNESAVGMQTASTLVADGNVQIALVSAAGYEAQAAGSIQSAGNVIAQAAAAFQAGDSSTGLGLLNSSLTNISSAASLNAQVSSALNNQVVF